MSDRPRAEPSFGARGPALTSVPGMPARGPGFGPGMRGGAKVRPRNLGDSLRRTWAYFRGEHGRLVLVFAFILGDSALGMAGPYLIGRGVDAVAAVAASPSSPIASAFGALELPFQALTLAAIALFAAYVGGAILQTIEGWLMAGISQRMVRNVREGLFDKMQRLPLAFYDTRPHGDTMSRLTNDVDAVSVTVSQSAVQLMSGVVVVAGTMTIMLSLSPLMALASMIPAPLVFALTSTIARRTRTLYKQQQDALGALNGHIEETVTGLQAVKAFGREPEARKRFGVINEELRRYGTRAQIWTGFLMPMMNVINNIGFAFVAVTGGYLTIRGTISVGLIATFVSYSRQFVRPLNDIANSYNTLMSAVAGAERVFEVMDEAEEPADTAGARSLERPRGDVEFRDVSFGYRPDVPVLQQVSFHAPAGSVTAIVGKTGAGKTTIVNLLSRFYEVSSGSILIDGIDIREYARASLRRSFGVVLQDGWLFAGTVRENILYGRPDATEEDMRSAAEVAGASHAIERLPQGYETRLVESGTNLSQGQRQLIAIARAVLAAPRLLILDEATSSVDARTELHIQQGMIELMKGRTSFIIAHRLSTIRDADTVLVVDAGRIVERGSPEELAAQEGYFKKLYDTQRGGVEI
jgi:ATP-binding cassette, subfamily B, multidrug efflux pump